MTWKTYPVFFCLGWYSIYSISCPKSLTSQYKRWLIFQEVSFHQMLKHTKVCLSVGSIKIHIYSLVDNFFQMLSRWFSYSTFFDKWYIYLLAFLLFIFFRFQWKSFFGVDKLCAWRAQMHKIHCYGMWLFCSELCQFNSQKRLLSSYLNLNQLGSNGDFILTLTSLNTG